MTPKLDEARLRDAIERIDAQLNSLSRPFDNVMACETEHLRIILDALSAERERGDRAVRLNVNAAVLMRLCTEPDDFDKADTLHVYSQMKIWLASLATQKAEGI